MYAGNFIYISFVLAVARPPSSGKRHLRHWTRLFFIPSLLFFLFFQTSVTSFLLTILHLLTLDVAFSKLISLQSEVDVIPITSEKLTVTHMKMCERIAIFFRTIECLLRTFVIVSKTFQLTHSTIFTRYTVRVYYSQIYWRVNFFILIVMQTDC